jgi:hypothetical protein
MSALGQKQTLERGSGMSALPPKADIAQHAIEDGVVADRPSICCTVDDSGACAVAGSCKQKKVRRAGSGAAAPAPGSGGAVDNCAPWVKLKLAACHEP